MNFPDISPWLISFVNWAVDLFPMILAFLKGLFGIAIGLSFPISLFFLIVIIYSVERVKVIRDKEAEIHDHKVEPAFDVVQTGDTALAHRWESVTTHIGSSSQNDWKQAIIDADIILDDLLTRMGYMGESVGEKLKRVNSGDMKTLNDAWEAHKIRNQIAHEGSNFLLDHHVANHTVHLYKKVFEEFYYI